MMNSPSCVIIALLIDTRMALKPETAQQDKGPASQGALVKLVAAIFYYQMIDHVLRKYIGVTDPLSLAISATITFLPAYWVPPRPHVGFSRYAITILALVAALAVELWAPDLLRQYMPIQLAVALPLLLLCLPLYYLVRKLAPTAGRKISLAQWVILFLMSAIIVAGAATIRQ